MTKLDIAPSATVAYCASCSKVHRIDMMYLAEDHQFYCAKCAEKTLKKG